MIFCLNQSYIDNFNSNLFVNFFKTLVIEKNICLEDVIQDEFIWIVTVLCTE